VREQTRPGDPPPDVPEEYAEAYQRGYRRALLGEPEPETEPETETEPEPTTRLGGLGASFEGAPRTHRGRRRRESKTWLVPVLLAVMVLGLVGAAYLLGRVFSSEVASTNVAEETPNGVALSDGGGTPEATRSQGSEEEGTDPGTDKGADKRRNQPYDGTVQRVRLASVDASCQYPSSVDAAGNRVSYPPAQVQDGDLSTAWRCAGDGVGERLTLSLPGEERIAEVGLVPGYAKTDPRTGADRYAENNRITEVRWILGDGEEFVQRLDGSSANRDLQTMRIPATRADTIVVEILASTGGSRNTVAVSEVRVAAAG
jgi:hypothetical protein